MRCYECGRQNLKQSKYCGCCGSRLISYNHICLFERLRAITWGIIAVFLVSTALAISFVRVPQATNSDTMDPDTFQSTLDGNVIYLSPSDMELNTPSSHLISDTPSCNETEDAFELETAYPISSELLLPIEALKNFILTGSADQARLALPPEYLSSQIANYGYATTIFGGEDAVIELYGEMLRISFEASYGKITDITYTVYSAVIINSEDISEICNTLSEYGMTTMPSDAYKLDIGMVISSSTQIITKNIEFRILLIDGKWYINPADISI